MRTNDCTIAYDALLAEVTAMSCAVEPALRSALPPLWLNAYMAMSLRPTDVVMFTYASFDYWFDAYQDPGLYDPASGTSPVEARLVAAVGVATPKSTNRDDPRLRGVTLSAMPEVRGAWDRGHFIGHAIGGTVDGNEANVFLQLRSANRGRYRSMERYCQQHPGVLCFSRPIYTDASAHPAQVEFGVLMPERKWWVDLIPNR